MREGRRTRPHPPVPLIHPFFRAEAQKIFSRPIFIRAAAGRACAERQGAQTSFAKIIFAIANRQRPVAKRSPFDRKENVWLPTLRSFKAAQ